MGYPKEVYDRAWTALMVRRDEARERTRQRREAIHREIPLIARIERDMARTAASVAKSIIAEPAMAARYVEELQRENLALQENRGLLLEEAGYPQDYLSEQYGCALCRDNGYRGHRLCDCMQSLLKKAACERLGEATQAGRFSFDKFSLSYYPEQPVDDSGVEPRRRMSQVLDVCRRYASEFSPQSDSLLFLGHTGLGKTHLSLAIASTVTEAGFGVLYSPVQKLMDRLEMEKFSRGEARESYSGSVEHILGCDLLVLDDLGTEFYTQFTTSTLFNIINSRLVEGRPTVISTNLDLNQIEEKYSPRMVSRLVCSYRVLKFYGKDIRFVKKQQG